MTDDEQLAIIEGAAKWMGWRSQPFDGGIIVERDGRWFTFNPLASLYDARRLLVECERRPDVSTGEVLFKLDDIIIAECGEDGWRQNWACPEAWLEWRRLTATAEQITLAVREVVNNLKQGKDGE